jgi:transposase
VPVKEIILSAPELDGPDAENYEIIRYEHTYRLAQLPASYEILKYKRPVYKNKVDQTLKTVAAPDNVFGKSFVDVSFVAGMLIDKFTYHLPLYRQHLRLKASYIEISRATLTHLVEKAALLLEPIAKAVLVSILDGELIAMEKHLPKQAARNKKA